MAIEKIKRIAEDLKENFEYVSDQRQYEKEKLGT
jgi:hypothetical protein